jgi:hypothetical protein
MRTVLDVDERTAAKLHELAAADGVSIDQLLAMYVPGLRSSESNGNGTMDPIPAFEEWADSFDQDAPPLSDEAVSRASIYRDIL